MNFFEADWNLKVGTDPVVSMTIGPTGYEDLVTVNIDGVTTYGVAFSNADPEHDYLAFTIYFRFHRGGAVVHHYFGRVIAYTHDAGRPIPLRYTVVKGQRKITNRDGAVVSQLDEEWTSNRPSE